MRAFAGLAMCRADLLRTCTRLDGAFAGDRSAAKFALA